MFRVLALITILSLPTVLSAPRNVLLARGRTEPVVAVDPSDPSHVVAASNTNYSAPLGDSYPPGTFASSDGGNTFSYRPAPLLRPYTTGADPSIAVAASGTVFLSYLGETPAYCSGGRSAVLLTTSGDHGYSYRTPTAVDTDPADDKPTMTVENVPGRRARVYIAWTRWHNNGSDIWFARSLDGGYSFSRPVMLGTSALDNFGAVPVAYRGRVTVFWAVSNEPAATSSADTYIAAATSTDEGARFGSPYAVTPHFAGEPRMALPGYLRNLTAPAVAVGAGGDLYMSWAAVGRHYSNGSVETNIWLRRAVAGGTRWTDPIRVNDVQTGDRFMPSVTVLHDGSVGVVFYDRRRSYSNLDLEAARIVFTHGRRVSPNVRVSGATSPISDIYYIAPGSTCFSPGRFFGDYIGASAALGRSMGVVWADTGLHHQDETDLWFARVTLP